MKIAHSFFNLLCLCICLQTVDAQSIDTVQVDSKKKNLSRWIQVSGGNLNLGSQFYYVKGIKARRDTWSWITNGGINLRLFRQIDIPLHFTYSDQRRSFSTPFNRLGISPSYKSFKVLLGYQNLEIARGTYTLNGRTTFGAGLSFISRKFRFTFLKGQFRTPRLASDTLIFGAEILPNYKRKTWITHIHLGGDRNYFESNFLYAFDDTTQIPNDSSLAPPAANFIPEFALGIGLFKSLQVTARGAVSLYSTNLFSPSLLENRHIPIISRIMPISFATRANIAFQTALRLRLGRGLQMSAKYEQVDPLFESMGTFYLLDDKANYTLNLHANISNKKKNNGESLSIAGSWGVQRNNIRGTKTQTSYRDIGHISVSYINSNGLEENGYRLSVFANASNYQIEQRDGLHVIEDTLRISSLTQNVHLNNNLEWLSGTNTHSLSLRATLNRFQSQQQTEIKYAQRNYEIAYATSKSGLQFNSSVLFWEGGIPSQINKRLGLSVGIQHEGIHQPAKRSRWTQNLQFVYSHFLPGGTISGRVWNLQAGVSFRPTAWQRIQFRMNLQRSTSRVRSAYLESRLSISYGITF